MIENIIAIQERYQIDTIKIVPFNHLEQPIFIEDDDPFQLLHIFLLDLHGGKIAEVKEGETVGEALALLTDTEKNNAKFVFFPELQQISVIWN